MMTYEEWKEETIDHYSQRIYGSPPFFIGWEKVNEEYMNDTYEKYKTWYMNHT